MPCGLLIAALLGSSLAGSPERQPPPPPAGPALGERYYITLFGAQSVPFRVRYTHTWATYVRTVITPAGEFPAAINTVSWMPATLSIRPLAIRPEQGVNLNLAETFAWVASFDGRVSCWGPYEIDAERYGRLVARKEQLETENFQYRAIGALTRRGDVSNCGQSFARSAPQVGRRYVQPTPNPGENGTSRLAVRFERLDAFIGGAVTHDWILPVIGANQYPFTRRQPGERVPYLR
jgi:hypothetical protein